MKILALVGSLRKASFSRKIVHAAEKAAPEGMLFEINDGRNLPLYDQDLDTEDKPAGVIELVGQMTAADALLFVTPEFNYSIPGTLKNLVDWASRPAFRSPLKDKPSLVIAHSPAPTGGGRAYKELVSVLSGTLTPTYVGPSFTISSVHQQFDESGALTDEITEGRLVKTLDGFGAWAAKQNA
ncbi:MAG: NADPH-dependent FMN reductase [Myxococcota bacterium]